MDLSRVKKLLLLLGGEEGKEKEKGKKKRERRLKKKMEISKLSGIDFFVAFLNNFPPFYGRHPRFVEQIFKGSENRERRITNKSDRRCRQRAD